jgi:hypothetical protein
MTVVRTGAAYALGTAIFAGVMCWSGSTDPSSPSELFSQAEARIGRPLTPVSYAGVARRTTRRTVAYTGAAAATTAAAATAAAAAAPPPTTTVVVTTPPPMTCTEVVDAAGNIVKTCKQ